MTAVVPGALPPDILDGLLRIGLTNPDPTDPLHKRLVATLVRVRGHSDGARLVALKFDFNWELKDAGVDLAVSKAAYDHYIDVETVRMRVRAASDGPKLSRIEAEQIARASDAAYALYLKAELAEQRERAMRKFLDTLSSAIDNHRTDRADMRQADSFQARGGVPEQR